MLRIYPVCLDIAKDAAQVVRHLQKHDPDLARQLRRAAASVCLNVAEGSYNEGGNRRARYSTALGSARETLACIEVADAMGYGATVSSAARDRLDRVIGTLVRLVR